MEHRFCNKCAMLHVTTLLVMTSSVLPLSSGASVTVSVEAKKTPPQMILASDVSLGFAGSVTSYCETEVFNASCPTGSAILMTYALYGRMKIGRCVRQDYGHVGCFADVIEMADERCSGRPRCEIAIPDSEFGLVQPCPEDLKPYFDASYECLPVQTPPIARCSQDKPLLITMTSPRTSGCLASYVTSSTRCGSRTTPWSIEVEEGQTIELTLYDFTAQRHLTPLLVGSPSKSSADSGPPCPVYAFVDEPGLRRNLTICGGGRSRQRHVYSSLTNRITVGLTVDELGDENHDDTPFYLLKYEAAGCSNAELRAINAIVTRVDNHAIITCNGSTISHRLRCVGNRWIGDDVIICEQAPHSTFVETTASFNGVFEDRQDETGAMYSENLSLDIGRFCVVVAITAIGMGLLVLAGGMYCITQRENPKSGPEAEMSTGYRSNKKTTSCLSCCKRSKSRDVRHQHRHLDKSSFNDVMDIRTQSWPEASHLLVVADKPEPEAIEGAEEVEELMASRHRHVNSNSDESRSCNMLRRLSMSLSSATNSRNNRFSQGVLVAKNDANPTAPKFPELKLELS